MRGRQLLSIALLAGVATLASAGQARAVLQLSLFENGVYLATFVDQGFGDINTDLGVLNVDTDVFVNPIITVADLTNLGATSNATTGTGPGQLGQNGDVNVLTDGTLDFVANDTEYLLPPSPTLMLSTASVSWTNGGGDTRTFDSYFDPANGEYDPTTGGVPVPAGIPAPTITQLIAGIAGSDSDTTSVGVPSVTPFALSNWTSLSFSAGVDKTIAFGGKTIVLGVPEPGTMALLLGGLPLVAVGAWRRRRAA